MLISWEKNPSKDFFSTYQYSDYNSLFLQNNLITKVVNPYQEKTFTQKNMFKNDNFVPHSINMDNNSRKKAIFKIFSQNLEWIKEEPKIEFRPDFSNGYLCPLCFNIFFEKDLDSNLKNFLTLEDIPPKSLGGKPRALTCKDCNSTSGHELDVHLLNNLLDIDVNSFLPNSKSNAIFELSGNKVNGTIEIEEDGKMNLNLQTNRSNPIEANNFISEFAFVAKAPSI